MMDVCLVNQRDLRFMRRAPFESFRPQIRGMFGSSEAAGWTAAGGARLSEPPEGNG